MSQKHLKQGDACPPVTKDKIQIISMRFCPFAQRARLVAAHKQIDHEVVNVSLEEKPDWFLAINPFGTVPCLVLNDKTLYESLVTSDFLDAITPDHRLNPEDPYLRAKQQIICAQFSRLLGPYMKGFYGPPDGYQSANEGMLKELKFFEDNLNDAFFAGGSVGMVDYMLWPAFERFPAMRHVMGLDPMPQDKFPKLSAWNEAMKTTPGVKATLISTDTHLKFRQSAVDKKTNYDI